MPDLNIKYAHAWDSMTKGIDQQGPYYQVKYYFRNWADSDDVANAMRGYTYRAGGVTTRIPPHTHLLSPNLSCTEVAIEGCGNAVLNAEGLPSFDSGFFVIATYRSLPWVLQGGNDPNNENQIDPTSPPLLWCTQELDYDTETIPYNGKRMYRWESDMKHTEIPVKKTIGITILVITFHKLPYLPMDVVRAKRGKINNATFLGAPAETILFKGARTTRDMNTDGTVSQRLQLTFHERDQSWNKSLRTDGTWAYYKDPAGNRVFDTADLSPLLNV